jgi:uncharacterized membrane protein (DUF485 family)
VLRAVLPPLIAGYVIFVLMVLSAQRRPVARPKAGAAWLGTRRRGFIRHLAVTTAGGYVVFLVIVALFHAWLGAERDALESALGEGALLAIAVLALFAGSALLPRRRERRPG